MPKFIIEREIPGAEKMSPQEIQGASAKSNDVLNTLGGEIQWVESFVTCDKMFCVFIAPSKELIEEHSEEVGFPANHIREVHSIIDPTKAEG